MNKILETEADLLNLLSIAPIDGSKLYFQFEYGEAQTAKNRNYSNPRIYWLQNEGGKFNMQGGYSPAYFVEDIKTMKRILSRLWESAIAHNEIFTYLDPLDISNFKINLLTRKETSWVSLFQLGGKVYAFTDLDDVTRFEKAMDHSIPKQVAVALAPKLREVMQSNPGIFPDTKPNEIMDVSVTLGKSLELDRFIAKSGKDRMIERGDEVVYQAALRLQLNPAFNLYNEEILYQVAEIRAEFQNDLEKSEIHWQVLQEQLQKFDKHFSNPRNLDAYLASRKEALIPLLDFAINIVKPSILSAGIKDIEGASVTLSKNRDGSIQIDRIEVPVYKRRLGLAGAAIRKLAQESVKTGIVLSANICPDSDQLAISNISDGLQRVFSRSGFLPLAMNGAIYRMDVDFYPERMKAVKFNTHGIDPAQEGKIYIGKIVEIHNQSNLIIQDVGRGKHIAHNRQNIDHKISEGEKLSISYDHNRCGKVTCLDKSRTSTIER